MKTFPVGPPDKAFIKAVEKESGQNISKCYQCGNCTAGCPMSFAFDAPVNRIMRLIQAGQKEAVLKSSAIWMCATCETCTQRCPNEIDVAHIMDVCRHIARRAGIKGVYPVHAFRQSFIDSVKANGLVHEIGLMVEYMFRTGRVLTDVDIAPPALLKNKMAFKPHKAVGRAEVADIFRRFAEGAHEEDKVRAKLARLESLKGKGAYGGQS